MPILKAAVLADREVISLQCARLEERDSVINQQNGQLEDLNSRLQTAVSRHEERETTLVEERNENITRGLEKDRQEAEIERQKQELELQKRKIERQSQELEAEISVLSKEYSRLKQQVGGDRPDNSNRNSLLCVEGDRTVVFEPCRHVCCSASSQTNFKNRPCHICRVPIQSWHVVFLS